MCSVTSREAPATLVIQQLQITCAIVHASLAKFCNRQDCLLLQSPECHKNAYLPTHLAPRFDGGAWVNLVRFSYQLGTLAVRPFANQI